MLNRDQIAHEYILSGVVTTVHSAFQLADAMIAEAQKRKNTERPAVIADDWVSVDDRLPENTQEVLAYRPDAHLEPACDRNIKICKYLAIHKTFIGSMHEVTHWQPLPSPPSAEKNE